MRNRLTTLLLALTVVAGTASLLAACNTTSGAGEDLTAAGKAISKSADQNQGY
jgi:predicted small secreted protein